MGYTDRTRQGSMNLAPDRNAITGAVNRSYANLLRNLVNTMHGAGVNISQRELNQKAAQHMGELRDELSVVTYDAIEDAFVQGEAQNIYALYDDMTVEEAKEFVGGSVPSNWRGDVPVANYVQQNPKLFEEIAATKLTKTGLTLSKAKELVTTEYSEDKYVRKLFEDTYGDILLATQNTEDNIKRVVREVVADTVQLKSLEDANSLSMADDIRKKLTRKGLSERIVEDGFVGIKDAAGRRWDLNTYSEMVAKTKTQQAFIEGEKALAKQLGIDLGVISTHGAEDECSYWEGVVVSMNGETEGYPNVDDIVASNECFHPNCGHRVNLIRRLESLPKEDQERHREKLMEVAGVENRAYKRKSTGKVYKPS